LYVLDKFLMLAICYITLYNILVLLGFRTLIVHFTVLDLFLLLFNLKFLYQICWSTLIRINKKLFLIFADHFVQRSSNWYKRWFLGKPFRSYKWRNMVRILRLVFYILFIFIDPPTFHTKNISVTFRSWSF
jgi:hypothetical protein